MKGLAGGTSRRMAKGAFRLALYCLLLTAYCLLSSAAEWRRQKTGTFAWLHAVHFVDANRGWAVGGKGALLSTVDGGATWKVLPAPTEDTLRDIFFTDERTGWIVCERDIYKLRTNDEARAYLLKTTNGGGSWSRVEAAGKDVNARLLRVVFADREHGWTFGEEGALFATTDGGATWARQRVPTRRLLLGGTFLDARTGWLAGASATLLYTSDGGTTWHEGSVVPASALSAESAPAAQVVAASAPTELPRINAVSFIDARRGWAVGSGGAIFATVNGGRSWRALRSATDADLHDVKFFDERVGCAVGAEGTVIHTWNGGETWHTRSVDTKHPLERLFFLDRETGWAVGFGGTILTFAKQKPSDHTEAERTPAAPKPRQNDEKPTP